MRSPEHRQIAPPRAGRRFEDELQLRYFSPGAFTLLPPEQAPPDPPSAPEPYKLTPSTRRHKDKAFAIIGEVNNSRNNSRSPSPTGRVSPFRGRGFNALGSRHASPSTTPLPPQDERLTPTIVSPKHISKIPQLKRRGSSSAFGERVYHNILSEPSRKLGNQLSQSLSSLEARSGRKPPPSPRKHVQSKTPAFQRLSPIIGSSPEPSQSQSSPSRIPKSRSTPPSRRSSPSRAEKPPVIRATSRVQSRSQSRNPSRTASREQSPTKNPTSPTRIPSYKNVQAKVNTFNKNHKPKVPPKPQVLSERSEDSDVNKNDKRSSLSRKESVNRLRTNSRTNLLPKTGNYSNNTNKNVLSDSSSNNLLDTNKNSVKNESSNSISNINANKVNRVSKKVQDKSKNADSSNPLDSAKNKDTNNNSSTKQGASKVNSNQSLTKNNTNKDNKATTTVSKDTNNVSVKTTDDGSSQNINNTATSNNGVSKLKKTDNSVKLSDILPSTTTVVSSTTSTVSQPLKIETKLNPPKQYDIPKPVSPMVDGRVLSATSVSNAMNKMNDTVQNTQSLIKEHGLSKLSPSVNAAISVANESKSINPAVDTKNATTALPKVEPINDKRVDITSNKVDNNTNSNKSNSNNVNNHSNHVTHTGIVMNSKALEMEVQKNMHKLLSPEHVKGNSTHKSVNDRIKEARTVVAADVKPIRIMVKEKPSDVMVQSGNVRHQNNISNGLSERPGLPPSQSQTPPNEPEKDTPPKNACSRFFSNCGKKISCDCCKKTPKETNEEDVVKDKAKKDFFKFLTKKKENSVSINVENETDDSSSKRKVWDRLNCCKKPRISDTTSCFPRGKRKESWQERRDSILSSSAPQRKCCSSTACKNFFKKVFCLNACCKKKVIEESISRKPSIMSKKKSLTPTTLPPPEDTRPKIDMSLVEHTSRMKGAIPVLPVYLAWFCLVMNCIAPGTGTFFSGFFCLCMGIPRFSQKDGAKQRIGAFIIDCIIGFSQFFTVLFCLVGWGWSIWWGVIMVKVAKKHKKLKHLEAIEEATNQATTAVNQNHRTRDLERN